MDTWKTKHPDFEYICWTEEELAKRNMRFQCYEAIHIIPEICGKVDIMRWEILYQYGGIFIDADSICMHPLDSSILQWPSFAAYENESLRPGLVAIGTMGFSKQHPICQYAIQWILQNTRSAIHSACRAWQTVGPCLLTKALAEVENHQVTILPSHVFLPIHHTGYRYQGHQKVYAYQEWGSTKNNYHLMDDIVVPPPLLQQPLGVSVLMSCKNTPANYLKECLDSILNQLGDFSMELVCVNDHSDERHTEILKQHLDQCLQQSRFLTIKLKTMKQTKCGLVAALNEGLKHCTHEYVFRMDSDDIMHPMRMFKQLEFMLTHSDSMICGTNVAMFQQIPGQPNFITTTQTNHPVRLTWLEYRSNPSVWFMNHPTLCFKKAAVLHVGGYTEDIYAEDLHLEVRLLKTFGVIYNLPECYLHYRIHENQITFQGKNTSLEKIQKRNQYVQHMVTT